jgi:hypothetical protein
MKRDEIDQLLSQQEEILPSYGFSDAVMHAIRQEAATPAPIPFPWLRATPGIVALVVSLIQLLRFALVRGHLKLATQAVSESWSASPHSLANPEALSVAAWLALLLVLTYAIVSLSMRLTAH